MYIHTGLCRCEYTKFENRQVLAMSEYYLEMKNISMNFGGVQALKKVHLNIKRGEVHALMGENGAGKSTLMKILQGILKPVEGEIFLNGEKIEFRSAKDAINRGIVMIHQELNVVRKMTVAENMFLGREPYKRILGLKVVNHKKMYHDAQKLYDELNLDLDPRKEMTEYSVAKSQLAEIAKAVSYNSDIVIMDEPTSALTEEEVVKLFHTIRILKEKGVTIIYISHKMDEIYKICDSVTVLRDGNYIGDGSLQDIKTPKLISMMVGRDISEIFPKLEAKITTPMLEVKHICSDEVHDVSFTLHKGEILGLAGLVGAGRTEIAETLYGARKMTSGEIWIDGKQVKIRSPKDAIKNRMVMVPEDRKNHGTILKLSISDNIIISKIRKCIKWFYISKKLEKTSVDDLIERIQIKVGKVSDPVSSLSGGNQQKVVVSKALYTDPEIIILDEPTRGIDVKTKAEIHLLISKFAQQGKAILMISSEMPEILGMSDRILVIKEGKIKGEVFRNEATQEKILELAF